VRGRSGTVIVALVLGIGLSVGALGAWWLVHARPRPGEIIDVLATPIGAVVVRHEQGSDRAFIELYDDSKLRWRGLIPRYAGGPGTLAVAASPHAVTVRVMRGGHPHVFAFHAGTGKKLDSFDLTPEAPPDPAAYTLPSVATVSDGRRGAEVLAAPGGGSVVIGVALEERRLAWRRSLPQQPTDAWIDGDLLVLDGPAGRQALALDDGADAAPPAGPTPGPAGVILDEARRQLRQPATGAVHALPATALVPRRYHVAGGRLWIVTPRAITVLDVGSMQPVATLH
jgi:hypothetical protein